MLPWGSIFLYFLEAGRCFRGVRKFHPGPPSENFPDLLGMHARDGCVGGLSAIMVVVGAVQ